MRITVECETEEERQWFAEHSSVPPLWQNVELVGIVGTDCLGQSFSWSWGPVETIAEKMAGAVVHMTVLAAQIGDPQSD